MRNDSLREPVSDTAPSGPDLDETGDESYGEYTMLAASRLPERFFSKESDGSNRDVPFDRSKIDLSAETEAINGLLRRTRDIRLLVLEIRFFALAGSLRGFADGVQDLAEMVELFWDSVHPGPEGDDYGRRINALEELESQVHVILPLTFAPIVGSGGAAISYRSYMLATEKARPREEEPVPTLDAVMSAIASPRNTEQATAASQAVVDASMALTAIRNIFIQKLGHGNAPSFDRQLKLLGEISGLLTEVRPDIASTGGTSETESASGESAPGDAAARPTIGAVRIATQAEAFAALAAIETYYQAHEPSAPALILVHQARMLFGKPLVSVLEALLPEGASTLALRFEGARQFDMRLEQMKAITDDAASSDTVPRPSDDDDAPSIVFAAETRNDATSLMLGVEAFYKTVEPSSPIPLLLAKARSLLNKDFSALLSELLPKEAG